MNDVRRVVWATTAVVLWLILPLVVVAQTAQVSATVQTAPVPGDADDPAIWIHPTDPSQSLIIGTDKNLGLAVFGLDGKQIQFLSGMKPDNVDLRYNFRLSVGPVDLVGLSNRTDNSIGLYRVNPETRQLENVAAQKISAGKYTYGFCMYHSPVSDKYYAFVTTSSGEVRQWELF